MMMMLGPDKVLELVSPYGAETAVYHWPLQQSQDKHNKHDGSIEIVETIRWVFEDLPELREAIRDELSDFTIRDDMKNYDSMKTLCHKYNAALKDILQTKPLKGKPLTRPSVGLLKHIIQKSYNHAVTDPEKLNEYNPWTPEVYGETSFEFVSQMLDTISVDPSDVFIDLGSGVGQVVLQVAASVQLKKCIGIEKADVPDVYGRELDRQFRFWMAWFGKTHSDYELIKGDFFDERYRNTILNASFIFCNNYAFGPKVDHSLKKMFEELKDGTRIFSSKAFSPVNFRITDRNLNDIGTIMHVRELQPTVKGSVSWTDNSVSYYSHTIDRSKLERYFLDMKQGGPKKEIDKRRGRPSRGSDSSLISSSNDSSNDSTAVSGHHDTGHSSGKEMKSNGKTGEEECIVYGPTTRTAWKEYCQSLCKNDKNNSSSTKNNNKNANKDGGKEMRLKKSNDSSNKVKEHSPDFASKSDEENKREVKVHKTRGRPRKYPPGVTAALNRAVKKGTKIAGVNEPRRPGRPPKDPKKKRDVNPLDTLHEQTLLSVQSGKRLSPAPGCVDRKLSESSIEETSGVPSVIVKDSSIQAVNEELDLLMSSWKRQMIDFLTFMQMPDFKTSVSKLIDEEKKRKNQLQTQVEAMEKAVKNLQERGVLALNVKLAELGIVATSADDVLDKAREIIAQNKALCEKEQQIQVEVSREETIHQELMKLVEKTTRKTPQVTEQRRSIDGDTVSTAGQRNGSVTQSPGRSSGSLAPPSQTTTSRPEVSNTTVSNNTPASNVANTSSLLLPPPAAPVPSRRGSAAKEPKAKREPKKRAAKKASLETSSSIDDIIADVSAEKKTTTEANVAKGNDKETTSPSNPGSQEESTTSKERLTLTLVINRGNNSASVKSPSRTPPDKSPFGAKNSPRSPLDNKRRQRSSERDSKSAKKTRSSKSSGPDTSSESETKLKIKLGSNKEPVSVEPVLPNPVVIPEKEPSSQGLAIPTTATTTTASKSSSATKKWQKGIDSNFDKLLAVASHEMSLQNAQQEAAQTSKDLENRVAPSPSMSSSSRPSSTSSSFATNTSLPQHQTLSDLAFNRRTACVNTPPLTPSPSFSADRPVTPGNSTSSSSLSPSLHHHSGHHMPTPSTSSASNHSNHDAFHSELPHHAPSVPSTASHQPMSSSAYINSLQSMKNLASMSYGVNNNTGSNINRTSLPEQRTVSTPAIEVPKGRKPGRPPKKSISSEIWASQLEAQSKSLDSVASSSVSTSSASLVSNHPHLSSSLSQCQYPNEVASDYSVKSKQSMSSSSSNNYYNGLPTNPGMNSISHGSSSLSSSSVIQSTGNKSNNPAPSGRSSSGPTHLPVPENLSTFYSHMSNMPYSSQGSSSSSAGSSYASVIRRHDPAATSAYPSFSGFPMMTPGYPGIPQNISLQQYESIQKEIQRSYLSYFQSNELAAAAAAQQKMMNRPSPRMDSSSTSKRDFNASSFPPNKLSSLMAGEPGK